MWIFGYGSLMWDDWETEFDSEKSEEAVLLGYRRAFNKASVLNWGSPDEPCPTLGLERETGVKCVGTAFNFSDDQEEEVIAYLKDREGASFDIVEVEITLSDGTDVKAYTAINDTSADTYVGDKSTEEVATMIKNAEGKDGKCIEYMRNIYSMLEEQSIHDPAVEELWSAIERNS
ncbi:gamma-glutamylcyclotransferase [Salinibacter altiplanensis]|uniref:gamma-glutamylcyclotransferase n=1 Tax=Salinibacter altiplanensis TaxID=1803181 RepID=UPI000C9F4072|nr:gamma-glutamylcyclotransferase [Salinibacter altiplanensis]